MNIAFAVVTLFSAGGLQRDCMALAARLIARGHRVTIFAERQFGEIPSGLDVELLPNLALSNHRRDLLFAEAVIRRCRGRFDRLVGFGKLLDLDVIYCADPCVAARRPGLLSRWLPRRSVQLRLEASSFAAGRRTRCLLLSEAQAEAYRRAWATEPSRMAILPPTIDATRRCPQMRVDGTRERVRRAIGIAPEQTLWLAVASQPHVKGLDRAVAALASFGAARLVIADIAEGSRQAAGLMRQAARAGVSGRVQFLGMRKDIPELMSAADLLVHPARYDTTGTVILEALVNGLPVATTAECGYASHVTAADAGHVVTSPFAQAEWVAALSEASSSARRQQWSDNGVAYGAAHDLYRGLDQAADLIAGGD